MTLFAFLLLEQLIGESRFKLFNIKVAGIVLGMINGAAAALIGVFSMETSIVLPVIANPLLCTLEFTMVSKASIRKQLYTYTMILLHFCCFYNVSAALVQLLLLNGPADTLAGTHYFRGTVYTITSILSTLTVAFMWRSPLFPIRDMKSLINDRQLSLTPFVYNAVAGVLMLISTHIVMPLTSSALMDQHGKVNYFLDMLLKMLIILGGSFLIIYMQCRQNRSKDTEIQLKNSLQEEINFRQKTMREGIAYYCANISQNRLTEGFENIKEPMTSLADNYNMFIRTFAGFSVHNSDWPVLYKLADINFYRDKLSTGSVFNITFRCSPSGIQQIFRLSEADAQRINSADNKKDWVWIDARCTVNIAPETNDILCYVSFMDVDDKVTQEQELRHAASTDSLTGVYNRKTAEQLINGFMKDKESGGTLFIIDLDYFKQVNDNLGHPTGDRLLIDTAKLIKTEFRDYDIVGRLGGDEFFVYAVGLLDADIIRERASSIEDGSQKTFTAENGTVVNTSVSIGIAVFPTDSDNYDQLYKHADAALYHAKDTGKGKFCFYNEL